MDNIFKDRLIEYRANTALTPSATVTIPFGTNSSSEVKEYTLTLDQNTILNLSGEYYTGSYIVVEITGQFTLGISQATYTFLGEGLVSGNFQNYDGSVSNILIIRCLNASTKRFVCNLLVNDNV